MKRRWLVTFTVTLLALLIGGLVYNRIFSSVESDTSRLDTDNLQLPTLASTVLADGLNNPWDLAFLPDSSVLVTERSGVISKILDGNKQEVLKLADVYAVGEAGLMGLAVSPDFASQRLVYACFASNDDIRVSRWRMDRSYRRLSEQKIIISGIPLNKSSFPGRHSGCRVRVAANGTLWVATGDAAQHTNPQNPTSLGGKILHVNKDGAPVAGNLGAPFDPRIYNYGHRNPQGLALTNDETVGYSVEHGPDRDDEVNLLKQGNFGWDPATGYDESLPMTDKRAYPDAIEAIWSSGDTTIAPSGMDIIRGDKWQAYNGAIALAVLKGQHIRLLKFNEEGKLTLEDEIVSKEYGRIRSVVLGPDQNLYFVTDNSNGQDKLVRLSAN